jgi:hypothetical protein
VCRTAGQPAVFRKAAGTAPVRLSCVGFEFLCACVPSSLRSCAPPAFFDHWSRRWESNYQSNVLSTSCRSADDNSDHAKQHETDKQSADRARLHSDSQVSYSRIARTKSGPPQNTFTAPQQGRAFPFRRCSQQLAAVSNPNWRIRPKRMLPLPCPLRTQGIKSGKIQPIEHM